MKNSGIWLGICLWLLAVLPARSDSFPLAHCHLESAPNKRMYGTLKLEFETDSAFTAGEWVAYVCKPPELAGQKETAVTFSVPGARASCAQVAEQSDLKRKLLSVRAYGYGGLEQRLPLEAHFWATLYSRRLCAGAAGPVVSICEAERRDCLCEEPTINFRSPEFQTWLDRQGLRLRGGERDIDFAWRVFEKIRRLYSYSFRVEQDRHISALCQASATDCGGLSFLLVGALRANSVPARPLVGRWAKSDNSQDDAAGYGQCHVKSEFWTSGVGWVPVEMSAAVSHKDADALNFFGRDNGDFLTLHEGTDLVLDSLFFGPKTIRNLQDFALWVTGTGAYSQVKRVVRWSVVADSLSSRVALPGSPSATGYAGCMP